MSKVISGLFSGTKGANAHSAQILESLLSGPSDEPTSVVWNHIDATQENYGGTDVPRSFVVDVPKTSFTPDGKLWTHGNATKHISEAVTSVKEYTPELINSNPRLYSQFILYDYYKTIGKAVKQKFELNKPFTVGNWEFIFVNDSKGGKYPVVKHSVFKGFKK